MRAIGDFGSDALAIATRQVMREGWPITVC
jgi:hypothetical protein